MNTVALRRVSPEFPAKALPESLTESLPRDPRAVSPSLHLTLYTACKRVMTLHTLEIACQARYIH
jgi:hypothetical protein